MHLAMGCVLIRLFTFQQLPEIQRRNAAIIVVGLTSFIVYHCITDEFVLHVMLFFGLSVTVGWQTRGLIRNEKGDKAHKKKLTSLLNFATCRCSELPNSRNAPRCVKINLRISTGNALFAYFLWNVDVTFCSTLTRWRRTIGMPWGVALELHGWWHVLTAVSCYTFMALIEFLTSPEDDESHALGFLWPVKTVLRSLDPGKSE